MQKLIKYKFLQIFLLAVLYLSCAHNDHITQKKTLYFQNQLKPNINNANERMPEYRLGAGDAFDVKFFNNPEFNESVTVRPDGRISLQRIGDLYIDGMTPSELDSLITVKYSEILLKPDITVIVREFSGHKVYVLGEVNTPGGYAIEKKMTILQALALAGGPKITAKLKSVVIMRQAEDSSVNVILSDMSNLKNGYSGRSDIQIKALDIIYVPKTFIGNVNTFLKQVFDGVLPPIDAYLRVMWWRQ